MKLYKRKVRTEKCKHFLSLNELILNPDIFYAWSMRIKLGILSYV